MKQYQPECRVSITSAGPNSRRSQRQGVIRSPDATLAPDTTCTYEFTGREDQRVWITFMAYRLDGTDERDCLTLTDGQEMVYRQCGQSVQPRVCPRMLVHANASVGIKPCRWQDNESYLSRTPRFSIKQELATGTALSPWNLVMRYEFITVDRFLQYPTTDGAASSREETDDLPLKTDDTPECYQLLESNKGNGTVSSPRNPLLYGRGGSRHLRCLYRFQVSPRARK